MGIYAWPRGGETQAWVDSYRAAKRMLKRIPPYPKWAGIPKEEWEAPAKWDSEDSEK